MKPTITETKTKEYEYEDDYERRIFPNLKSAMKYAHPSTRNESDGLVFEVKRAGNKL